jgi:hypothetical protein
MNYSVGRRGHLASCRATKHIRHRTPPCVEAAAVTAPPHRVFGSGAHLVSRCVVRLTHRRIACLVQREPESASWPLSGFW